MSEWGALIGAGAGLLGQAMASRSADKAAATQLHAANKAAEMSKFTPYGVTTGFGQSWFDTEKQTAGYTLDPALAAYRDQLMMMGAGSLPTEIDPTARADQYYGEMVDMMQPSRQMEQTQLQQNLFGSGRLGMRLAGEAAGAGAGGGMYQPDVLGYNKATELANQQLAMQARQQSMNELDAAIARGTGLMTSGFGVEQLGMGTIGMGSELGGRATAAGTQAGSALLGGAQAAAQANLASGVGWANTLGDIGGRLMTYGGYGTGEK